MKWYDIFSNFYDSSLEKIYFDSRKRAIELLDLKSGQVILDVACGTGANFKHIKSTGIDVDIYGTDFSKGMLNRGLSAIKKNNWNDITLFQADARKLTTSFIKEQINKEPSFDLLICTLGLSVVPDWELVLNNMLHLLKEEGRIVIVDVFAEKRTFHTWLIEKIAGGDMDRKIWQTLEDRTTDFYHEYCLVK